MVKMRVESGSRGLGGWRGLKLLLILVESILPKPIALAHPTVVSKVFFTPPAFHHYLDTSAATGQILCCLEANSLPLLQRSHIGSRVKAGRAAQSGAF